MFLCHVLEIHKWLIYLKISEFRISSPKMEMIEISSGLKWAYFRPGTPKLSFQKIDANARIVQQNYFVQQF